MVALAIAASLGTVNARAIVTLIISQNQLLRLQPLRHPRLRPTTLYQALPATQLPAHATIVPLENVAVAVTAGAWSILATARSLLLVRGPVEA